MPSLDDQLRAYGQRIRQDLAPAREERERGDPAGAYRGAPRWSQRSGWLVLAAAATAALLIVSALLPVRPEGDLMNRKASGFALGVCLFVGGCTSDTDGDPSRTTPTTAATSTVAPAPLFFPGNSSVIEPGTYEVDRLGTPIHVTIPAGWTRFQDFAISGSDERFMAFFDIIAVSADACEWRTNGTKDIGRSVDDLVTALQAQLNTVTTTPEPLQVSGFTGQKLAVEAPPDLDVGTCDEGARVGWKDKSGNIVPIANAGGLNVVMALDLDGQRGVITYGAYQPMTEQTKAQLDAMVASLKIG